MSPSKLRERIIMALVEEANRDGGLAEPENSISAFLERSADRVLEICQDEQRYGAGRGSR
jgi:hypothetical protein